MVGAMEWKPYDTGKLKERTRYCVMGPYHSFHSGVLGLWIPMPRGCLTPVC